MVEQDEVAKALGVAPWELPMVAGNLADVGKNWPQYRAKIDNTEYQANQVPDLQNKVSQNGADVNNLNGRLIQQDNEIRSIDNRLDGKADRSELNGKVDKGELYNFATKNELDGKMDKSDLTGFAKKEDIDAQKQTLNDQNQKIDSMKKPVNDWIDAMDFLNGLPGKYPKKQYVAGKTTYSGGAGGGVTRGGTGASGMARSLSSDAKDRFDAIFQLGASADDILSASNDLFNVQRANMENVASIDSVRRTVDSQGQDLINVNNKVGDLDFKVKGIQSDIKNLPTGGGTGTTLDMTSLQQLIDNKDKVLNFDGNVKSTVDYTYLLGKIDGPMIDAKLSPDMIQGNINDSWLKAKILDLSPTALSIDQVKAQLKLPDTFVDPTKFDTVLGKVTALAQTNNQLIGVSNSINSMALAMQTFVAGFQDPSDHIASIDEHASKMKDNADSWKLVEVAKEAAYMGGAAYNAVMDIATDMSNLKSLIVTMKGQMDSMKLAIDTIQTKFAGA